MLGRTVVVEAGMPVEVRLNRRQVRTACVGAHAPSFEALSAAGYEVRPRGK